MNPHDAAREREHGPEWWAMEQEQDPDNHEDGTGHEICDVCGDQMWWDEAGTSWRCWTCETRYE